jgi:hypothetical protein
MTLRTFKAVIVLTTVLVLIGLFRLNELNQKPFDSSQFSWINKVEIYTLGLVMSVIAYPLYPEIAQEHLMLYRPFEGKTKVINDDFFLRSKRIRKAIDEAKSTGKEVRLWWPISDYALKPSWDQYWESRVALAFNGGWLRVQGDQVIARIPIKYPKRAFAPIVTIPWVGTLGVEEGLFWVLQQEGWYHTGEVEWIAYLDEELK